MQLVQTFRPVLLENIIKNEGNNFLFIFRTSHEGVKGLFLIHKLNFFDTTFAGFN